jgi:hypothetical protein
MWNHPVSGIPHLTADGCLEERSSERNHLTRTGHCRSANCRLSPTADAQQVPRRICIAIFKTAAPQTNSLSDPRRTRKRRQLRRRPN